MRKANKTAKAMVMRSEYRTRTVKVKKGKGSYTRKVKHKG